MIVKDNPTQPRLSFCLPYSTLASILEPLSLPPHLASLIVGAWVAFLNPRYAMEKVIAVSLKRSYKCSSNAILGQ